MRFFLDLDDVLVDFCGAVCQIHGTTLADVRRTWPPELWGIDAALGLSDEDFWEPIYMMGEQFWADLPLLPWAKQLLGYVQEYTPDWYIISTPAKSASSWSGKQLWMEKHLPGHVDRLVLSRRPKAEVGHPVDGAVIVDDREPTVDLWNSMGGLGILLPFHHNSARHFIGSELDYVFNKLRNHPNGG